MFSLVNRRISAQLIKKCKTQIKNMSTVKENKKQERAFHKSMVLPNEDLQGLAISNVDGRNNKTLDLNEELDGLMSVFPDVVKDLTDIGKLTNISELQTYHNEFLPYILLSGKKLRALATITSYKMFENNENLTPRNMKLANIMGWTLELLQGSLLITDDIVDHSETRRGAPCWHKKENVGFRAIHDACFLESGIHLLLKKYFSGHRFYVPIMELFHDVFLKTILGQTLDSMSVKNERPNFEHFTINEYYLLIKYKTICYTYHLPFLLGMYLANVSNPDLEEHSKIILNKIGTLFQIKNDFVDCFGDSKLTGKGESDIQEGKCTWLAVMALQRANPSQKKIMENYYGRWDSEAVAIIKDLFKELNLPDLYFRYEKESLNEIQTDIQKAPSELPQELFLTMMKQC